MRNRILTTEIRETEYYKGIEIHADRSLHSQAMALLEQYVAPGANVLDVGAGAGAFSKRLADNGFRVTAIDKDSSKWTADGIEFHERDVDRWFADAVRERVDAAVCLEVIEHVENPWHLLRETRNTLVEGGYLILSTPNITSFLSRLMFMRTGHFHMFREPDLEYGHISPISAFHLQYMAKETGYALIEIKAGGYLPIFDFSFFGLRVVIGNLLRAAAYLYAKNHPQGSTLLFVFRRHTSG